MRDPLVLARAGMAALATSKGDSTLTSSKRLKSSTLPSVIGAMIKRPAANTTESTPVKEWSY